MTGDPQDHGQSSPAMVAYELDQQAPPDDNLNSLIDNWRHYREGLVLFLGAGASMGATNTAGATFPLAAQLRDEIWREFMCAPAERASFDGAYLGTMTLEHASALAEVKAGPLPLRKFVQQRFEARLPLWQHAVLPFLQPQSIFTVNYDNLVEVGWRVQESRDSVKPCEPVFGPLASRPADRMPVFKSHGSVAFFRENVGEGGLVLTQFDYFEMIAKRARMLRDFMDTFRDGCAVFVGYSFFDADIASCLYEMRKSRRDVHWYAVFPRDDAGVRRMYETHYGILQINRRFHHFLAALDDALDLIPQEWKFDQIPRLIAERRIQG